jgi:hypothetical protein
MMQGRRIFIMVFFVFGLWAMATGIRMGIEGWQARSWPVAKGRMLKAVVKEYRTARNIRVARLCLELDYLYMVGETIMNGSRLDAGWRCFASEKNLKEKLASYPSGKEIKVRYNPARPEISMLEPGIPWAAMLMCGTGLVIFSVLWPFYRRGVQKN